MTFHVKSWMSYVLVAGLGAALSVGFYLSGWVRGYHEAKEVQERGWNSVAYTLDNRRTQVDLERLLSRPVTEGCYQTLYALEREYPVPLLLALQRANVETECLTEAFKAGNETFRAKRQRPAPAKLPAGQGRFQPVSWSWPMGFEVWAWMPTPGKEE